MLNRSRLAHQLANVLRKHLYLSAAGDVAIGQPMLNTPKGFPEWLEEFERDSTVLGNDPDPDRETRTFHDRVVAEFIEPPGRCSIF